MNSKRIWIVFALLLACMLTLSAAADFAPGSDAVVFVSDNGLSTNDGLSAAKPVQSLERAYALLSAKQGGTIVVSGTVTVDPKNGFKAPDAGGAVCITSVYGGTDYRQGGAKLALAADMSFANDTYFDNIAIDYQKGALAFSGNFHNLGFGAGVTCSTSATGNLTPPILVAGVNNPETLAEASTDKDFTLSVAGGTWQAVMGGNRRATIKTAVGVLSGDARVLVSGGTFGTGVANQMVSPTGQNYHTGRTYMEITGGTFNCEFRVYRNIGTAPGSAALDEKVGIHGQFVVRVSGGTFKGNLVLASDLPTVVYNDASTALVLTGGTFAQVPKVQSQAAVGPTVVYATPAIERILTLKSDPSFYFSNDFAPVAEKTMDVHFQGRVTELPDPYVIYHEGVYYYCYSSGGVKIQASTELLLGNPGKSAVQVFTPAMTSIPNAKKEYWAPELHYFSKEEVGEKDYGWYIYVAADDGKDVNHRMYVMKASDPDNALSRYNMVGELELDGDTWAIDGTVLKLGGKLYFVWSGRAGNDLKYSQDIYIQEMTNPYTATGKKTMLAKPEQAWETKAGSHVNEGPQVVVHEGTTNIIYSVNGSWTQHYALASLTYLGGDPLSVSSWKKSDKALFESNAKNSMYGTGHSSYVQNYADGTWWIYYHANPSLTVPNGSSWWKERNTYLQQFTFEEQTIGGKTYSIPEFGVPLKPTDLRTVIMQAPNYCAGEHLAATDAAGKSFCGICGVSLQDAPAATGVELKMTVGKTDYTVNGETKTMDVAPIIANSRTMLPVRYVAEALGATIAWDGATSTATITTADTEVRITVGASEAVVNGKAVTLDSPAFIENSRTYMPVRFVAETLGGAVAWDGATSTATITK